MKKILSIVFIVFLIAIQFVGFLPQKVEANSTYVPWYNSSWIYRKSFNIIGSSDGTQTNYQLRVYCYYGAGTDTGFVLREPTSASYTADAGTNTTTIVDAVLISTVDSYYVGAKVYNSTRSLWSVVTAYVAATKTLTISPAIAAQTTADLYYLYEIPPVIYFNAKCKSDFTDLIFTRNDGTTTLDYWIESYTASNTAIIWVEFNSIVLPPTVNTFWVYYGNPAATSASNGDNTFIIFDNFDSYANGSNINGQGGWVGTAATATVQNTYNRSVGGVNSLFIRNGAAYGYQTSTASNNKAYMFWLYKLDACNNMFFEHGDGTTRIYAGADNTESIVYVNGAGATIDSTYNTVADVWRNWSVDNINFTTDTYRVIESGYNIIPNIPMFIDNSRINQWWHIDYAAADVGFYLDDYCVRNFTINEPRWGTFTAEVAVGATQTIQDVAVFKSYLTTGDWLFAIRYLDVYYPYFDTADIRQYFVFQLCNLAGTVVAQTPVLAWGNKPGSIYISPTLATALEWGSAYTVKIYGLMSGNPTATWTLTSANWLGSDLTNLDSWVLSSVSVIQSYYYVQPSTTATVSGSTTTTTSGTSTSPSSTALTNQDLTVYISGRGQVLNSTGSAIFELGIPGLSYVRPNLFQTYSTPGVSPTGTFQQTYRQELGNWQTNIGADGTVMLTRLGNLFGMTGNIVMIIIMMAFIIIVAAVAFPMGHTTASLVLCILMLFSIVFWGLDPAWLVIITVVSAFLLFKQFIMDKGN
jgi:hypothetical protein